MKIIYFQDYTLLNNQWGSKINQKGNQSVLRKMKLESKPKKKGKKRIKQMHSKREVIAINLKGR